jgi:dihydrofolate reductase
MRRIISTMQVSLDGMAQGPNGKTDFIGGGSHNFDWDLFDHVDACVLGRVMYPEYEQYWRAIQAGGPGSPDEVRYAEFADRTPHYVLTRTVSEFAWPVARAAADLDAVHELRESEGDVIYVVGGPSTLTAFLEADLLDELRLTVHSVILGGGLSLFGKVVGEHGFNLVDAIPLDARSVRLVHRARR